MGVELLERGGGIPDRLMPELIENGIKPSNALDLMSGYAESLDGVDIVTADVLKYVGVPVKGDLPEKTVVHRLYTEPNTYPPTGEPQVVSTAFGLERSEWDPQTNVENHWQWLEPPEKAVDEDFNAYRSVSQRADVSMHWKIHAVLGGEPYLAVNPVQYSSFPAQEQEWVLEEMRDTLRVLDGEEPRTGGMSVTDSVKQMWKTRLRRPSFGVKSGGGYESWKTTPTPACSCTTTGTG